jgi:D-glycero-beta-D-manno-heptose-7-phosphate kinase
VIENNYIDNIFEQFTQKNVLIVGDIMTDAYWWGNVNRISPEAPVPVVLKKKEERRPGGAANVALNIKSLGAKPFICSIVGNDFEGKYLLSILKENEMEIGGIFMSSERCTTVKTRIIGNNYQMLRIDEEVDRNLSENEKNNVKDLFHKIIEEQKIDVIIFEDYDKGLIDEELIEHIVNTAKEKNIPTTADPKKNNFLSYKNISLFKPNFKEMKEGLKKDIAFEIEDIEKNIEELKTQLNADSVMVTLSEKGVVLKNKNQFYHIPAHYRNIADVSGAGDTVISVASLCLACKTPLNFVAALSNLAGGLVCERVGVVPIDKEILKKEALKLNLS